jgi:hypothetical protein
MLTDAVAALPCTVFFGSLTAGQKFMDIPGTADGISEPRRRIILLNTY